LRFFNGFVSLKNQLKERKERKEKKGAREREISSWNRILQKCPMSALFYPHLAIGIAFF
jgi:hypothetical protein